MAGFLSTNLPDSVIFRGISGRAVGARVESNVIRWHTVSTVGDVKDTVASHTFEVMKASWMIAHLLVARGYSVDMALLFELAMFHSVEEGVTGNFPHGYKASMGPKEREEFDQYIRRGAGEAIGYRFASALHALIQQRWDTARQKEVLEAQIVAVANCVSAVSFLEEQVLQRGNTTLKKVFLEYVTELSSLRGRYKWLEEIWELIFG